METTYNFKTDKYDYPVGKRFVKGTFTDYRNGIPCENPTCDLECYMNYIELLNSNISKWRNYGYLDLGLMPLVMAPSFMHEQMKELMLKAISSLNLHSYLLPSVSLLYDKRIWSDTDVWLVRSEVAKCMGVPESRLSLQEFIRWWFK